MAMNQDPSALIKQLKLLPDPALQQFAAANRGDTSMVALAVGESNNRKKLRADKQAQAAGIKPPPVVDQDIAQIAPQPQQMAQLPEQQGIGALPAPNMQRMADGGIAGYDDSAAQLEYTTEPVMRMAEGGIAHFRDQGAVQGAPEEYRAYALQRAKAMGLDPMFIDSIFSHESRYNPRAQSPTGPVGIGQLTKATAKAYGLDPSERTNPYKNIDASLRFMTDLNNKYGGDKTKMAVAYNQGETYLDKHLRENQGQVVPSKLKAEPQNYLTKTVRKIAEGATDLLVPSAYAGEVPGQAAPKAEAAAPAAAEPRAITGNQAVVGAGETALQYLTGLAAIPTAGGAAVLGQLPNVLSGKGADRAEMEKSFREKAGQVTYEPRTEGGKAVSEGFAKTLEDLKIPPYLAHMGHLSPTRGRAGIPAAELEALATEKTRMAETPRLTGPGVSETMVQGKGELPVRNARAVAQQLADIDEAKAWRDTVLEGKATKGVESTRPEVLARNAELARAQGIAAAASPAATAGTYVQPSPEGIAALTGDANAPDNIDVGGGFNPASGAGDKETAKAAEGKSPNSRFSDDDLLMLGLGMMANNRPGTGNKLGDLVASAGQAGIGAIQAKREREKQESDTLYKAAMAKHYGVDPLIQRLEALKNPETAAMFQKMKELEREPQTRETIAKTWMSSPFLQMQYPKLDDYLKMTETAMSGKSGVTAPKISQDDLALIHKFTG